MEIHRKQRQAPIQPACGDCRRCRSALACSCAVGRAGICFPAQRRLVPPSDLEPTLQIGVLEPEVRIEVVGEDGVLGGRRQGGRAFYLTGQELGGHAFRRGVDQVVDVRSAVANDVTHVVQHVSGVQVVGIEQGQQEVGIEVAAVEQRINEAVCVCAWWGW